MAGSCDDDHMTRRWAWIDEYVTHHQILRAVTALRKRPSPQQAAAGTVLRVRLGAVVMILCGLLLVLTALAGGLPAGDAGAFILILIFGTVSFTFGCWICAGARPLADRVTARKARLVVPGGLILQPRYASIPSPTSDPEEESPPPLPADLI